MQQTMHRLAAAPALRASTRGRRCCRPAANWMPDYSLGGNKAAPRTAEQASESNSPSVPTRKWWDYRSPSASVGRPNVQLNSVSIPQVSPGGGDNGSSGRGGNGGGGGGGGGWGGDNMRGFTYLFASLLFAGGLAGYIRKGSSSSLLFSSGVAILLLISASLLHHRSGKLLALGTCLVLATVMGQRANRSRKVFPAGVIAILSALMTAGYARCLT